MAAERPIQLGLDFTIGFSFLQEKLLLLFYQISTHRDDFPLVSDHGKVEKTMQGFEKTAHFIERQQQRGITDPLVTVAIACGEKFYQGSELVYFLGRKHLERAQRKLGAVLSEREVRRAEGTVVVVGVDNHLITT